MKKIAVGIFAALLALGVGAQLSPDLLSQLSFQRDGAGAVPRSVLEKLRNDLPRNVRDFGAKCDGSGRDDALFIQRAIDDLPIVGGIVEIPGDCTISSGLTINKHKVTLRGVGSGDYTVGYASRITTSTAALNAISVTSHNAIRIENLAIVQTAASPTGRGITFTNSSNCALVNAVVIGWDIGVRLAPGPLASFNCQIIGGQILNNVSKNIDAQANTNGLRIFGTEFGGSTQIGLSIRDSNSPYIVGGCEGASVACIDIDATSTLNVAAFIAIHNENTVKGNPKGGVIRLGNTAKVSGVAIVGSLFYANVPSTTPVNALNGSVYSLNGITREGTWSSDQTISEQRFQDTGNGAFDIARDTNITGSGASFNFTQKNDANAWKKFSRMFMTATGVGAGTETGKIVALALYGGLEREVGAFEFDSGGTPSVRSSGNLRLGGVNGPRILSGTGTPEAAVVGNVGDIYLRTNGGAGSVLYVKESGTGNTGWAAK